MTTRLLVRLASAALLGVTCGCTHPTADRKVGIHAQPRIEEWLGTLRAGMTPQEAARDVLRLGGTPVVSSGLHMRRQRAYSFPPKGAVTLQFDAQDRLVSWTRWETSGKD